MRISLLQSREPFASIIEQTLAQFWIQQYGTPFEVAWQSGRPDYEVARNATQIWLINNYLNAIFTAEASAGVFEPIRREFSRSSVWWKRPLQNVYVRQATSAWAGRLAQDHMQVTPRVPGSEQIIIVPGNHKIRLLDSRAGLAFCVPKYGFLPEFTQNELAMRQWAAAEGVPVPQIVEVAADGWFSERFISGTPLNRLAQKEEAKTAVRTVATALSRFQERSCQWEGWFSYVRQVQAEIKTLVQNNQLLSSVNKEAITVQTEELVLQITGEGNRPVLIAQSHGDFQPANILVNGDGVWLIDWEYSQKRQAGYDLLVFGLSSRFPRGLARRLQSFVCNGWVDDMPLAHVPWNGPNLEEQETRFGHAGLFLLEELLLQLHENSEPLFFHPGQALIALLSEIGLWLELQEDNG